MDEAELGRQLEALVEAYRSSLDRVRAGQPAIHDYAARPFTSNDANPQDCAHTKTPPTIDPMSSPRTSPAVGN